MLLLGLGAYWLARSYNVLFPDTLRLATDSACDLRAGRCDRHLPGGGRLSFSFLPRTLPLMKPLTLQVELRDREVDGVLVDIVGLNMAMGLNRTRLVRHADGVWKGETLLPVCTRQTMEWEAAVWLEDGGVILAVPHRFTTSRE
jgi:hypothetical protein